MKRTKAQELGDYFRSQREGRGLSQRRLAILSGVNQSSVNRIERGDFASPSPETLKVLAEALDLPLDAVWSLVGYDLTDTLPEPMPFLRAKYRDLPDDRLNALTDDVAQLLKRHGIDPYGRPAPHEDEDTNPTHSKDHENIST